MIVPFRVGLDQVFLSGNLFCFGCLLLFVVCNFNDDVSDQINHGKLLLFVFNCSL